MVILNDLLHGTYLQRKEEMYFDSSLVPLCAVVSGDILPTSNTGVSQAPTRFKVLPYILWDIRKLNTLSWHQALDM